MSTGSGRAKIQSAYARFLQKNTWAAMVALKPDLAGTNPDFSTMSVNKVWAWIDTVETANGMNREEIEKITKAL